MRRWSEWKWGSSEEKEEGDRGKKKEGKGRGE